MGARRDGLVWLVRLGDRAAVVPDTVGMGYLAELIEHAGVEIATVELAKADEAERARVEVRKAIKRALASITEIEPVLGGEIASRVVTGTRCVYRGAQLDADPLRRRERLRPAREVNDQVVAVRRRWISPRTTSTSITAGGDEGHDGGDAGDAADRRPGERRQQQATQRLAPEQAVALPGDLISCGLQFGDGRFVRAGLLGLDDGRLGLPLAARRDRRRWRRRRCRRGGRRCSWRRPRPRRRS